MSYLARAYYNGDGATTQFPIPFPYISEDHLEAYVDGVAFTGAITFPSSAIMALTPAPEAGVGNVEVLRATPLGAILATFQAGTVAPQDLNLDALQLLYIDQELIDQLNFIQSGGLPGPVAPFTPQMFGAKCDRLSFNDASISLGAPGLLTTPSNGTSIPQFTGSKLIAVIGASASTFSLHCNATWVNAHALSLSVNATAAVTNADAAISSDDTVAARAWITAAGQGATLEVTESFGVSGTLTLLPGQTFVGQGWHEVVNTTTEVIGTVIQLFNLADISLWSIIGADDGHQMPNWAIKDIALIRYREAAGAVATAVFAMNARKPEISNVFISGFGTAIHLDQNCWKHNIRRVTLYEAQTGIYLGNESDDCVIEDVDISLFRTTGVGIKLDALCQTPTFLNVQFKAMKYGVLMNVGDTSGVGTGTPYPMHLNIEGCQFEDMLTAGIYNISSSQAQAQNLYPKITYNTCRQFASGSFATADSGQTAIFSEHHADLVVINPIHSGLSYGYVIGKNFDVSTFSGTACGPTVIIGDGSTYGTSQINSGASSLANVSLIPGDSPLARFSANALTNGIGATTAIDFSTVVKDFWGWNAPALTPKAVVPNRANQHVRFHAQVKIDAAALGTYQLFLFKAGVEIAELDNITTAGTVAIILKGTYLDLTDGAQAYTIRLFSSVSATIDTDAKVTFLQASLVGA